MPCIVGQVFGEIAGHFLRAVSNTYLLLRFGWGVHPFSPQEMAGDLTEYLTNYARQNPGTAALTCLALGFVLGWKLKPW